MKKICIEKITMPRKNSEYIKHKMYSVALGNGYTEYFTNAKDARKYIADTNRFLNNRLHTLNWCYIYVFQEYRKAWFYMPDNGGVAVRRIFEGIETGFSQLMDNCSGPNGNYFTFKNLFNIIERLLEGIIIIQNILINRKYYADVYRLNIYQQMIIKCKEDLQKYGTAELNENDYLELID